MHSPDDKRWVYHSETDGLVDNVPEIVMLGNDDTHKVQPLIEHNHPGCYEFVLIERGTSSWEIGGKLYPTQAGDLFYTRPGEAHKGGFNMIEPCKFWWFIVKEPLEANWMLLPQEECREMEYKLSLLPRVIRTGLAPLDSFRKLKKALQIDQSPYRSLFVRNAALELILMILQPAHTSNLVPYDLQKNFDALIERMGIEPEWRPTVDELASSAGISSSHFYRMFQAYTGEPPISYIERVRMKTACQLLNETQQSITTISHNLGFQSSQHFATVFKRFIGVTPSEWRK